MGCANERRKRRLHGVGSPQMLPVRLWKLIEGNEPIPIGLQTPRRVGIPVVLAPVQKPVATLFRFSTRRCRRDRAQQGFGGALLPLSELIKNIEERILGTRASALENVTSRLSVSVRQWHGCMGSAPSSYERYQVRSIGVLLSAAEIASAQ